MKVYMKEKKKKKTQRLPDFSVVVNHRKSFPLKFSLFDVSQWTQIYQKQGEILVSKSITSRFISLLAIK